MIAVIVTASQGAVFIFAFFVQAVLGSFSENLRKTDEEQNVKLERIIEIMCDDANTWFSSKIRFFLKQFQRREPSDYVNKKESNWSTINPSKRKVNRTLQRPLEFMQVLRFFTIFLL